MISFPANTDIFVVHNTVSFSCGIDGMVKYCRMLLNQDPIGRAYFLFLNKRKEQIRVLWYDGHGFSLCTKRLSQGRFSNWPKKTEDLFSILSFSNAQILFSDGDIKNSNVKKIWKKIS